MSIRASARWAVPVLAAALVSVAPLSLAVSAHEAADRLADKFVGAEESSETVKREADRTAEDARKREAELKADAARQESAARKAAELLKANQLRRRAEAQRRNSTLKATQSRTEEEADMLARARREAEEMKALEEARILAEQADAMQRAQAQLRASGDALQQRAKSEAQPRNDAATAREAAQGAAAAEADAALALARAEETRRLAERLKRVRQIHAARLAQQAQRAEAERATAERATAERATAERAAVERAQVEQQEEQQAQSAAKAMAPSASVAVAPPRVVDVPAGIVEPSATADNRASASAQESATSSGPVATATATKRAADAALADALASDASLRVGRVAVLLVLAPGTYGIRRHGPKVADPLLCTPDGCYVSAGADADAYFLRGHMAFGFANTFGARAGACRQSLGCVFRGVDIRAVPAYLQPVDLHIIKHDGRRIQVITADSACAAVAGRLSCNRGIYADDYVMWVVPESIANAAGAAALAHAVAEGLSGPRSAGLAAGN